MKYIIENFSSLNELIRVTKTRPANAVFKDKKLSSDKDDFEFTHTHNFDEAVDLLRNGYEKPLEQIKNGVETQTNAMTAQRTTVRNDVVGYAPCVPNAILGIPQSMINKEMIAKKAKIVNIIFDTTGAWYTTEEQFIKAGIAVLTIVNSLELNGYRVSLKVVFKNSREHDESVMGSVTVKDWRQPLDLKKMAFPFCHPSMLRRFGFRWLETQPRLTERGFTFGYGESVASSDSYDTIVKNLTENKVLGENDKYLNIKFCENHGFDPQEIAKACGLNNN